MRNYIKGTLEREGYSVHAMKSAEESLEELKSQDFQINLVNVDLPGIMWVRVNDANQRAKTDTLFYCHGKQEVNHQCRRLPEGWI